MAAVNLDTTKIELADGVHVADLTDYAVVAGDATDGCFFTVDKPNNGYVILGLNSNQEATARTFTIKAGDSEMFKGADLASGNIAAGKTRALYIKDLGKYKIMTGTNKGKIKIEVSHADMKIAVVELG